MNELMEDKLAKLRTLTKEQVKASGITKVYMDADGCLVDWEGYVGKRLHHFNKELFSVEDYRGNIPVLNGMEREARATLIKRYYRMYPDTFLDLDILPTFHYLIEIMTILRKLDLEVSILTSLDVHHHDLKLAEYQKGYNLKLHMSNVSVNFPIEVVKTHEGKLAYADKHSILIDDYHRNVDQFISASGKGILFMDTELVVDELFDLLRP